jgi:hypothetical protein
LADLIGSLSTIVLPLALLAVAVFELRRRRAARREQADDESTGNDEPFDMSDDTERKNELGP